MEYSDDHHREDFNIKDIGKPFQKAGEAVKNTASTTGGAIKNTASTVGDKTKDIAGKAKNVATDVGGKIKDTASTVGSKIKSGLSTAFGKVLGALKKVWEFLKRFKVWLMIICAVCVISLLMPYIAPLFGFAKGTFSVGKSIFGMFSRKSTTPQTIYDQGYGAQTYGTYGQGYGAQTYGTYGQGYGAQTYGVRY